METIQEELFRRAIEMRALSFDVWATADPRHICDGSPSGIRECAVFRYDSDAEIEEALLSRSAADAVHEFLLIHEEEYHTTELVFYNDSHASDPTDVAILLEKVAANL